MSVVIAYWITVTAVTRIPSFVNKDRANIPSATPPELSITCILTIIFKHTIRRYPRTWDIRRVAYYLTLLLLFTLYHGTIRIRVAFAISTSKTRYKPRHDKVYSVISSVS